MTRKFFEAALFTLLLAIPALADGNPIVVGKTARFTVITPGCVRIEYSGAGTFIDERSLFAVNRDARSADFTLRTSGSATIIETPMMKLLYTPDGKALSPANLTIVVKAAKGGPRWTPGMPNVRNLGGTNRTLDGVTEEVKLQDGLLSRDGWYLHDDSRRPLLTSDWEKQRPLTAGSDWYFFAYGNDYKAALQDLATISGSVPLPRKNVLGSWYSRYWPYSSEEYRQIVDEYEKYDFPIDAMVMDMDWHKDGWTGWSWNRTLLPDAEKLLKWFHDKDLAVTLNLHPADGVKPHEDMYGTFMKDMGVDVVAHPDSVVPFDAANRNYVETLLRDIHEPLEAAGVDFWWLDWQQFGQTRGNAELSNLEWLNNVYFKHTGKNGRRGISFSRWGGWGDHRHPIHFSGDASTRWPMLEFEVPFTTTAGNVGCFFWSHDIGGHMGGFYPETNCRWIQFGAVSAALRLHSTRDATMDKRPWLRDSIYTVSQRLAFHLRSELFPYIYSSAWRSVSAMVPLTAPMYIDYPGREIAYEVPQEYMFGPALLAAPITSTGIGATKVAAQQVWLPEGRWFNWFTGERFDGSGKIISVLADINEFPLYARAGVPVPMQHYTQRMATAKLKEVIIRTYPGVKGASGTSLLYEDDGVTNDYTRGKHATTEIAYARSGDVHEITVRPAIGEYTGQVKERSYVIEFPCTAKPGSASINGVSCTALYDDARMTTRVTTGVLPIGAGVTVRVTAADADPAIARERASSRRLAGILGTAQPAGGAFTVAAIAGLKETLSAEQYEIALQMMSGLTVKCKKGRVDIIKSADSRAGSQLTVSVVDAAKHTVRTLLHREFSLANGGVITFPLAGQSTELLGETTVRSMSLEYTLDGKTYTLKRKISEQESAVKEWNVIGPFTFDPRIGIADVAAEPEKERVYDLGKPYTGMNGQQVRWQTVRAGSVDIVDLGGIFKTDNSLAYALVYLRSERRQVIKFKANSDDGIELFINGAKIHSNNVMRGIEAGPDVVEGFLQAGVNTLLVKISQGSGGWAFRLKAETEEPIESSVTRFK